MGEGLMLLIMMASLLTRHHDHEGASVRTHILHVPGNHRAVWRVPAQVLVRREDAERSTIRIVPVPIEVEQE